MNYLFVVRFEDAGPSTLEGLLALEDRLIEELDGIAEVDGHDISSGEAHIVLFTRHPVELWDRIEPMIEKAAEEDLVAVAAAYRPADGDDFTVLWPADFDGEFDYE